MLQCAARGTVDMGGGKRGEKLVKIFYHKKLLGVENWILLDAVKNGETEKTSVLLWLVREGVPAHR